MDPNSSEPMRLSSQTSISPDREQPEIQVSVHHEPSGLNHNVSTQLKLNKVWGYRNDRSTQPEASWHNPARHLYMGQQGAPQRDLVEIREMLTSLVDMILTQEALAQQ